MTEDHVVTDYEVALLCLLAVLAICQICDTVWLRSRVKELKASEKWLSAALANQAEVHQAVLDRHTRDLEKLNEAQTKFAARVQGKLNELPDFVRLNATVDRLLKSSMYRDTASRAAMQRLLEDGQAELRREVYVDGEMAAGIGSEAERTRTAGDPDGAGR